MKANVCMSTEWFSIILTHSDNFLNLVVILWYPIMSVCLNGELLNYHSRIHNICVWLLLNLSLLLACFWHSSSKCTLVLMFRFRVNLVMLWWFFAWHGVFPCTSNVIYSSYYFLYKSAVHYVFIIVVIGFVNICYIWVYKEGIKYIALPYILEIIFFNNILLHT